MVNTCDNVHSLVFVHTIFSSPRVRVLKNSHNPQLASQGPGLPSMTQRMDGCHLYWSKRNQQGVFSTSPQTIEEKKTKMLIKALFLSQTIPRASLRPALTLKHMYHWTMATIEHHFHYAVHMRSSLGHILHLLMQTSTGRSLTIQMGAL